MNVVQLLALAVQLAESAAKVTRSVNEIRAVIARDHPESLEQFDALVASARAPWSEAAQTASR